MARLRAEIEFLDDGYKASNAVVAWGVPWKDHAVEKKLAFVGLP
jgi:hypothetical protein